MGKIRKLFLICMFGASGTCALTANAGSTGENLPPSSTGGQSAGGSTATPDPPPATAEPYAPPSGNVYTVPGNPGLPNMAVPAPNGRPGDVSCPAIARICKDGQAGRPIVQGGRCAFVCPEDSENGKNSAPPQLPRVAPAL